MLLALAVLAAGTVAGAPAPAPTPPETPTDPVREAGSEPALRDATVLSSDDRFDPNEEPETAAEIAEGTHSNLTIGANESDWYYLDGVEAGSTVTVTVSSDRDVNLTVLVYYPTENDTLTPELGQVTEPGTTRVSVTTGSDSLDSGKVPAGTDVIFEVLGDEQVATDYSMNVSVADRFTDNYAPGTAASIEAGTYPDLAVTDDRTDWYALDDLPANTTVTVEAVAQRDVNLTVVVYYPNENGTLTPELGQVTEPGTTRATVVTGNDMLYAEDVPPGADVVFSVDGDAQYALNVTVEEPNEPPGVGTVLIVNSTPAVGENVSFRADASDPDGRIASYEWDMDGDGRIEDTGPNAVYTYPAPGTYEVTLTVTDDDGATDTSTTRVDVAPAANDSVVVDLVPESRTVAPGGTVTYEVVARGLDTGIGSFDLNVSVGNASVAGIESAEVALPARLPRADVSRQGDAVRLQAVDVDSSASGAVTLATVVVEARTDTRGTTRLVPGGDLLLANRTGARYGVARVDAATVEASIASAPDVTGDGYHATDPDGDGRYEDVDGDGRVDVLDVAALLGALDRRAVNANASLFDFSGDGRVDILDVAALLEGI